MSIMRYDPFGDLATLRESMDLLFDECFGRTRRRDALTVWSPAVEMYEEGDSVVVRAELPAVDPKHVDVTVTHDAVTSKGQMREETERKDRNDYLRELRAGGVSRTLPLEVQGDAAKATYTNGVLEVRIPKSERVKPKSVKVEVQGS